MHVKSALNREQFFNELILETFIALKLLIKRILKGRSMICVKTKKKMLINVTTTFTQASFFFFTLRAELIDLHKR